MASGSVNRENFNIEKGLTIFEILYIKSAIYHDIYREKNIIFEKKSF